MIVTTVISSSNKPKKCVYTCTHPQNSYLKLEKKKKETQCKKPEQSTDCFFFEHWTRVREWQERFRLRTLGVGSTGEATGTERHFIGFKEDKPLFGIGGTSGRKPAFFWVGWWSIWFSLRSKKNLTRNGGFMMGTKNNEVRKKKIKWETEEMTDLTLKTVKL